MVSESTSSNGPSTLLITQEMCPIIKGLSGFLETWSPEQMDDLKAEWSAIKRANYKLPFIVDLDGDLKNTSYPLVLLLVKLIKSNYDAGVNTDMKIGKNITLLPQGIIVIIEEILKKLVPKQHEKIVLKGADLKQEPLQTREPLTLKLPEDPIYDLYKKIRRRIGELLEGLKKKNKK